MRFDPLRRQASKRPPTTGDQVVTCFMCRAVCVSGSRSCRKCGMPFLWSWSEWEEKASRPRRSPPTHDSVDGMVNRWLVGTLIVAACMVTAVIWLSVAGW